MCKWPGWDNQGNVWKTREEKTEHRRLKCVAAIAAIGQCLQDRLENCRTGARTEASAQVPRVTRLLQRKLKDFMTFVNSLPFSLSGKLDCVIRYCHCLSLAITGSCQWTVMGGIPLPACNCRFKRPAYFTCWHQRIMGLNSKWNRPKMIYTLDS